MDGNDRHHGPSETRLVASRTNDCVHIEQLLGRAESHVNRMQPSAATLHLRCLLDSCRRAMDDWTASPPTDEELRALRGQVEQTLQLASTTSPTVRLRRMA